MATVARPASGCWLKTCWGHGQTKRDANAWGAKRGPSNSIKSEENQMLFMIAAFVFTLVIAMMVGGQS